MQRFTERGVVLVLEECAMRAVTVWLPRTGSSLRDLRVFVDEMGLQPDRAGRGVGELATAAHRRLVEAAGEPRRVQVLAEHIAEYGRV
jgi:hypothetical protein